MIVRISGSVEIYSAENYETNTDPSIAKGFDGFKYTDVEMSDYLIDYSDTILGGLGLTGGYIEFQFDTSENRLWVVTEYSSPRELTQDEISALVEYTQGQWSDGMGTNFEIPHADENQVCTELYNSEQTIRVEQL